ncbi:MAG: nickel-dependent lactate racemase [Spirochaetes bacterium]|nr:nickel-dependent lactate racemase [Spirochaetota bacterium]
MKVQFKFAQTYEEVELPDRNVLGVLHPAQVFHEDEEKTEPSGAGGKENRILQEALKNPIGTHPLRNLVNPGETVVIVTSDITRPMPSSKVLPLVLEELCRGGIQEKDITIVLGLGIHRPHTEAERAKLVGSDIACRLRLQDSNPSDTVLLGYTKRGTPVRVDRTVAEANRRVLLGNIEYHYFAGYSGGMKAIMPGVSTREAIQNNHGFMLEEGAEAGRIEGNPVREDIDEVLDHCPVDFILNVVLSEEKRIVGAFAGHPIQAHRVGCRLLDRMYKTPIPEQADIVLVSSGGFPKDINLYQAQKALDNAKYAVKKGGIIIFHAACTEGYGEGLFEEWMKTKTPVEMLREIRQDFRLGAHKAAAIAAVLDKVSIFIVSDLPRTEVPPGMTPFANIPDALEEAFRRKGKEATILAMPAGGSTLPVFQRE